ncbi:MAG: atpF [Candidatus Paceibacter sp.]|nr:atpF [Candidatus Paceibacter sp.]
MEEFIRQFGIDWKLLIAQVVNFLILLYLLKRFAYGPIIHMLNIRRKKIEDGMKAASAAERQLQEAERTRNEIIVKAESESLTIVSKAADTAKDQAQSIIETAEGKSERIIAASQKKLEEDRLKLEEEVTQEAEKLIKKGLAVTLGKMDPSERDEVLIKEALRELTAARS